MSKNTNLSFLTDYITADIVNGRIGINNASPTVAFDVTGLNRFVGTTASDTAPLGSELAAVTGTGTNWALAGTNLNVGGYTHTVGSTTALTTSLAAVNGTYYQIVYTITGRTAGSITIDYGGTSTAGITATGNTGPQASSTGVLTITPTTDFNGTVVLSIKSIGTSSASSTFANSGGTSNIEVRASSITTNTFIGLNAGSKNTTGLGNTFIGQAAGQNNTTGASNTFIGQAAGQNNTTGATNTYIGINAGQNTNSLDNTFIGGNAGYFTTTGSGNSFLGSATGFNNTTGSLNVFFGRNAGRFISNASTSATIINNSIMVGYQTKPLADNQTNQIVIGHDSTGLGSNTTVLGNSSTLTAAIYGNLVLGSTTDAGYKLDVTGTARVSGALTLGGNALLSYSSNTTTANAFPRLGVSNINATQQDYNISELYVSAGNGAVNGSLMASYSSSFPTSTPSITLRNNGNSPLYFSTNGTIRQVITGGGNILLGTESDNGNKLQVTGGISASGNINGSSFSMNIGSNFLYGTGYLRSSNGTSVTTSTTTIYTSTDIGGVLSGNLVVVTGVRSGNGVNFVDLILYMNSGSISVISSQVFGSPPGRSYSVSGTNLNLSMASGTYIVACVALIQGYTNP